MQYGWQDPTFRNSPLIILLLFYCYGDRTDVLMLSSFHFVSSFPFLLVLVFLVRYLVQHIRFFLAAQMRKRSLRLTDASSPFMGLISAGGNRDGRSVVGSAVCGGFLSGLTNVKRHAVNRLTHFHQPNDLN
jgi:hypothetical protein